MFSYWETVERIAKVLDLNFEFEPVLTSLEELDCLIRGRELLNWYMGYPDSTLLDLIERIKSWISWGNSYSNSVSGRFQMDKSNCNSCVHCAKKIFNGSCIKYHCQSCGRILCGNCASLDAVSHSNFTVDVVIDVKSCKLCFELGPLSKSFRRCSGKIYPSESPRQSPEPQSPSFSGERIDGNSPQAMAGSDASCSNNQSPVSTRRSPSRSDEDEGEESMSYYFSTAREYYGNGYKIIESNPTGFLSLAWNDVPLLTVSSWF